MIAGAGRRAKTVGRLERISSWSRLKEMLMSKGLSARGRSDSRVHGNHTFGDGLTFGMAVVAGLAATVGSASLAGAAEPGAARPDGIQAVAFPAGRPLDRVLNSLRMGPSSPSRDRGEDAYIEVAKGRPWGQTFRVSPDVVEVARIALWVAFWNASWDPDEKLVVTLWDSPERRVSYGRAGLPYDRRMYEGAIAMFPVGARVEGGREYYFELTVETEPLRPARVPREWLLAASRPAAGGGDGVIDGIGLADGDYAEGSAYEAGTLQTRDLWFEVHVRERADRDGLYQRAFARFDLERPELAALRAAVEAKDWDRAVNALVRHFEGRDDLIDPERRTPKLDPAFDTHEADLAAAGKVQVKDGTEVDLGSRWDHARLWPERGGVGLTRSGLRKPLATGYEHTGNAKYARAFNDMLMYFFLDRPSPVLAGVYPGDGEIPSSLPKGLAGGTMWSALSIGARMLHGFHWYTPFVDSPWFTEDARAAFIINLGQMAEVLERMRGGGNWATQMADALFKFGQKYPEFRRSKVWFEQGFSGLVANALSTVRPDGVLQEPTTNYHLLVLNRYSKAVERARELGLDIPEEMVELTEKMFAFVMDSTFPDGTMPAWGDSNHPVTTDLYERAAKLYPRADFAYFASGATRGTPPVHTSRAYPSGGFYYQRSGWDPKADVMGIRCGRFGSHGHFDALSLVLAVRGRTLLYDPGIHTYGTDQARELTATRSHSTVTVNGWDADSATCKQWVTTDGFDYFAGVNVGYRANREVVHARQIWFIKREGPWPGLWLVLDDVAGPTNASKDGEVTLRYRFAPVPVAVDETRQAAWTHDARPAVDGADGKEGVAAGHGQLLIQAAGDARTSMTLGEAIGVWGDLRETPVLSYTRTGPLPADFVTALRPFEGTGVPTVRLERLAVAGAPAARAVWYEEKDRALAVVSPTHSAEARPKPGAGGSATVRLPDGRNLQVDGAGVAVRFVRYDEVSWRAVGVHGVAVRKVSLGDERLVDRDAYGPVDVRR